MSTASEPRPTWVRQYVLAALCVATALNYIQRNSISGAETTIRSDLHLAMEQTGNAASAFFLSYALCQIPSGWLAQRLSPRWALSLFAAGWSLATMACALAQDADQLVWARLVMGVMQAGIFPCATMILLAWYPATRRALASAILNSFMLIGSAAGSMPTGALLGPLGWRGMFVAYALPGIVWALWFAWWFRNQPREHAGVNDAELALLSGADARQSSAPFRWKRRKRGAFRGGLPAIGERGKGLPLLTVFLSWPLFFLCFQQFCRAGATRFFDVWFSTYLQEARGQPRDHANFLMSLPLWAGVVGGVVGGWVSDTVLRYTGSRRAGRQGVAIGSLLACCVCYAAAYLMPNVYAAVALMSMGAFIAMFAAPCAYALSMDMGGRNLGVVFGAMNMVGNFGAYAFTWVIPHLKKWGGGWTLPVAVFGGMHLVAAACWLLLNPDGVIGDPGTRKQGLPMADDKVEAVK